MKYLVYKLRLTRLMDKTFQNQTQSQLTTYLKIYVYAIGIYFYVQ